MDLNERSARGFQGRARAFPTQMVTRGDRALSAITAPVSPQRPLAIMLLLPWLQIHSFHSICIGREMEGRASERQEREKHLFIFLSPAFQRAHLDASEVNRRHQLGKHGVRSLAIPLRAQSHYAGSRLDSRADALGRFLGWRQPTFITSSSQRDDRGS